MTFNSVLIANRGEIALRVMRSVRAAGLRSVAVHTRADADSPHVAYADQAVCIGVGPVGDSYLSVEQVLAAAQETGAEAVHPGYGFLSENADFARAVEAAGLVWIGPPPDAVELMGNKAAAKRKVIAAGVPCVPGYEGADQSDGAFEKAAARIGYPVMVKAAAGGGGRGMRLVDDAAGLPGALALARSEALGAFGSDELILEKAVVDARHVEVQVFADQHGVTVHLGERDCSVQRRHQKVVEEAPCPVMTESLRAEMGAAAVAAAQAVDYVGAGTVEFLLDGGGAFYFLEMNTRLQVEHPVTEMVTGRDLVDLQLRVAAGEPLGFAQQDVALTGHAIEVRLYAEDPTAGFLPSTGRIALWEPGEGPGVRVDDGIVTGQEISPFYDPMLAKLVAHGATRAEALRRLVAALRDSSLFGVATNRDFLIEVLGRPAFVEGTATTGFVGAEFPDGFARDIPFETWARAAFEMRQAQARGLQAQAGCQDALMGWSSAGALRDYVTLRSGAEEHRFAIEEDPDGEVRISSDFGRGVFTTDGRYDGVRMEQGRVLVDADWNEVHMNLGAGCFAFERVTASARARERQAGAGDLILAPMHGNLLELQVSVGDLVCEGDRVGVLEAMKMQHELRAVQAGRVVETGAAPGDQVKAGQLLVRLEVGS